MNRLLRRNLAFCTPLLLAACAPLVAADALPKAETILDKFVEVTGGKAAFEKLHNEVSTGTMEMGAMGIKGAVTNYRAEPDKSYSEIDIAGVGKMQEGYDGKVAWSLSAMQGAHIKDADEKAQSVRMSHFHSEDWKAVYKKAETAGIESVEGKDCYKVLLTPESGSPIAQYFDKQSGLLVRMTMTVKTPMGEIDAESLIADYRKEGDILAPHKITQKAMGQTIAITVDTIKYNVDLPKDRFDLPAEIQALVNKK